MEHDVLLNWFILVGVFSIALISPGPDFVIAVRNSVQYNRRAGIMTAFGFAAGVSIHVAYCLMGLAAIIAQSVMIFTVIKFIGAGYLFCVGISALKSGGFTMPEQLDSGETTQKTTNRLSDWSAFRGGFITNLFNPKATMFFLALFTQVLNPDIPLSVSAVYGLTCVTMTALWFSLVATVLTIPSVRDKFVRVSKWIDRVCGSVLIALGVKLALSKATN